MSEVMRWKLKGFIPGVEGVSKALFQPWVVPAEDFDRVTAERDALQQRLNAADEALHKADDDFALMSLEAAQRMELLEIDAARYRWLRERDLNSIHEGGVFAGRTPQNIVLNGEHLDQAIDAVLSPAEGTNTSGKAHCPNDGICHTSDETCAEAQARIDSLNPAKGGGNDA